MSCDSYFLHATFPFHPITCHLHRIKVTSTVALHVGFCPWKCTTSVAVTQQHNRKTIKKKHHENISTWLWHNTLCQLQIDSTVQNSSAQAWHCRVEQRSTSYMAARYCLPHDVWYCCNARALSATSIVLRHNRIDVDRHKYSLEPYTTEDIWLTQPINSMNQNGIFWMAHVIYMHSRYTVRCDQCAIVRSHVYPLFTSPSRCR